MDEAREQLAAAWHAAGAADSEESVAAAAADYERCLAYEANVAAQVAPAVELAKQKARLYDDMLKSPEHLAAALLPCGRTAYPNYSVSGAKTFQEYDKQCVYGNCPKKLFAPREACGWEVQIGAGCPIDMAPLRCAWHVWTQQLRTPAKEDSDPYYSLEFVPKQNGTRASFFAELRTEVTLLHLPAPYTYYAHYTYSYYAYYTYYTYDTSPLLTFTHLRRCPSGCRTYGGTA